MNNANGVSRGDRNRNARLCRLRAAVPTTNAIVGIDLADVKQMVVVCDHDSKVLARRIFRCKAWDLGRALEWAGQRASKAGYGGVTVACEPTGHRWRVLGQLAEQRGMSFVCVQPMLSSHARKAEDLTRLPALNAPQRRATAHRCPAHRTRRTSRASSFSTPRSTARISIYLGASHADRRPVQESCARHLARSRS